MENLWQTIGILLFFAACGSEIRDSPELVTVDSTAIRLTPDLVSGGTAIVTPGPHYAAGTIKRLLFGSYYRDVWTTPFEVPIIDLDRTAGGLTPLERGGGKQSITLHLLGADGRVYDLRSIDKYAEGWLRPKYLGTIVESITQDQISSMNPVGALLVPPLAEAAGILHTSPSLVVVPASPRLGIYRRELGGMLALFERDPDESHTDAAHFGYSRNIISTARMFEKLRENPLNRVDERAYVRARIFDMLIGDWDRHEGQWRWAEFENERGIRFLPVPTDRDFAFARFDGLLNRIGRRLGVMLLRRMVDFDDDIPDVLGLNWQALTLDRRLTRSLTGDDWVEIADSLRIAMTDEVIDRAVRTWPEPVIDLVGPMTARNLKSRRELLPSVASRYYEVLVDSHAVRGPALSL